MPASFSVWDGAEENTPLEFGLWDGTNELPSTVQLMPHGKPVSKMFTDGKVLTIAHRGGSVDWAEMSMRGYTESVLRGVDTLEFSVGRTKDNVLFGLHDQTLDRTSPDAPPNLDPKQYTWAEISSFMANGGADTAFGPQRYERLTDVLDKYAGSHSFFIDPKYLIHTPQELDMLLGVMDSYPNSTDRFVGKFYGTGTQWASRCRARGYKTWGYYYSTDIASGVLANSQAAWDYIGHDGSAPQTEWNTFLSYGKPVIAHSVSSPSIATAAIAKGASGLMVTAVRSVMTALNA